MILISGKTGEQNVNSVFWVRSKAVSLYKVVLTHFFFNYLPIKVMHFGFYRHLQREETLHWFRSL